MNLDLKSKYLNPLLGFIDIALGDEHKTFSLANFYFLASSLVFFIDKFFCVFVTQNQLI